METYALRVKRELESKLANYRSTYNIWYKLFTIIYTTSSLVAGIVAIYMTFEMSDVENMEKIILMTYAIGAIGKFIYLFVSGLYWDIIYLYWKQELIETALFDRFNSISTCHSILLYFIIIIIWYLSMGLSSLLFIVYTSVEGFNPNKIHVVYYTIVVILELLIGIIYMLGLLYKVCHCNDVPKLCTFVKDNICINSRPEEV